MKAKENRKQIHEMSDDALFERGSELRETMFRLRFKQSLGDVDSARLIAATRKELARVKTEVRAREVKAAIAEGTHRGPRRPRSQRTRRA